MPVGTASDLDTRWWGIIDDAGNPAARFDHIKFSAIQNGAGVTYTGPDADGVAHNVQPATTVARYMARVSAPETLSDEEQSRLLDHIMTGLLAPGSETVADRQARLRRLRAAIDRFGT